MTLRAEELASASTRTIGHYDSNASSFRDGTWDHDVSQNIEALLAAIEGAPPYDVLDLGCGPGRDLVAFRSRGHLPVGLDGSQNFCEMARRLSGCEVWHQNFLEMELPEARFDGVFANATLFHVPSQELPRVLQQLRETLRPGGILFSSNPRGANQEGWSGDRFGAYHDLEAWRGYLTAAGFSELSHYYRPPGLPLEEQPWLASVWKTAP